MHGRVLPLRDGRVIVTVGSAEKAAACRALGADHAIDYKGEDFVAEVHECCPISPSALPPRIIIVSLDPRTEIRREAIQQLRACRPGRRAPFE